MALRNLTNHNNGSHSSDSNEDIPNSYSSSSGNEKYNSNMNTSSSWENNGSSSNLNGGGVKNGSQPSGLDDPFHHPLDRASDHEKQQQEYMTGHYPVDNNSIKKNDEYNQVTLSTPQQQDYSGYYSGKNNSNGANNNNTSSDNNSFSNIQQQQLYQPNNRGFQTPSISHSNSYNDLISTPMAYDRYPVVSSKNIKMQNSYTNLDLKTAGGPIPRSASNTSMMTNGGPGLNEEGISPFGGYPASSFPLLLSEKEEDDYFHNPDPEEEARLDRKRFSDDFVHMSRKSFGGWLGVLFLFLGGAVVFIVIPALTFTGAGVHRDHGDPHANGGGSKSGNSTEVLTYYKYPQLAAIRTSLVDPDTPSSALTRTSKGGDSWDLVFSDEFNANGRTFYAGDDQFWTAPDLHYDATKDLEWYSPDASTTSNGTLQLRMDAYKTHNLYYRSGMLQSWNKLCFTQGALEISAKLPNYGRVTGLWPGLWTMGNLARPGYLASTEGVWPYSYEACDAGITPNQSSPDGISYLPGQKLSVCTCDGEEHPNQGTGRGAPELDILEAEADTTLGVGIASQSMQIAPFDIWYIPDYKFIEIYNFTTTTMNNYCGGPFQQAVSAVTTLNTTWYQFGPDAGYFQKYAIEFLNDQETGYVRWFVGDNPTLTIHSKALHPNGNIDWRLISKEPMSIIMNLGISNNWAYIDWQSIYFPVTMMIDYVRLYQPSNAKSLTCDPDDYPTYDYIQDHLLAYSNANLTSWEQAGFSFPKNVLTGNCKSSLFKS